MATLKIKVELGDETKRILDALSNAKAKSEPIGNPLSNHRYHVGDCVWSHPLKTVGIVTMAFDYQIRIDEDPDVLHMPPDLHPVSMACYDEFKRMRASIGIYQDAIAKDALSVRCGSTVLHLGTGRAMMIAHISAGSSSAVANDGPDKITDDVKNFEPISRKAYELLRKSQGAAKELHEALGLLTTLAPKMVIDPDHPIKMAREIVRVVRNDRDFICEIANRFNQKPTTNSTSSVPPQGPT